MKNFILDDPFYFTLFLIILAFIIGILSKARNKDRCLKHFENYPVNIENIKGKIVAKGILKVRTTGFEIKFLKEKIINRQIIQATYLIYKYEFELLQSIFINLSELNEKNQSHRNKKFKIIKKPGLLRKIIRKSRNLFNSLKDSFIEIMNISINYFSSKNASFLQAHDQNIRNLNTELLESVGLSHDPILEDCIGKCIVFELLKGDQKLLLKGILYDYTKKFIEILDVDYANNETQKVDIIVPQKLAIIRGLCAEQTKHLQ